jgi:hypothetical protein
MKRYAGSLTPLRVETSMELASDGKGERRKKT